MPSAIISIPIVGSNKFNRPHAPATIIAKTIRAMADGTLDSQVGARICNGLGIMRACLETQGWSNWRPVWVRSVGFWERELSFPLR
jgi:hypothetical protein